MTPKELYEWAAERGAQNYEVMVDCIAIDHIPPKIDEKCKVIDIVR